jgi:hypothetical protein
MLKIAFVAAIGWGIWWLLLRGGCGTSGALECPKDPALDEGVGIALVKDQVCPGAGYFCHEMRREFHVARWPLDTGKLRVRVALPEFADEAWARELRDAAVEGIMGWDRRPFPLVLDTGRRTPILGWDINVNWHQGAGGGHARVGLDVKGKRLKYSIDGLQVLVPPVRMDLAGASEDQVGAMAIAMMKGGIPGSMTRDQVLALVKATASHEMGHALGLMHSDSERDIMFPQYRPGVTPDGPSGRDFRTLESLYSLPNGAMLQ